MVQADLFRMPMFLAVFNSVDDKKDERKKHHAAKLDIDSGHGRLLLSNPTLTAKNVTQTAMPTTANANENGRSATN